MPFDTDISEGERALIAADPFTPEGGEAALFDFIDGPKGYWNISADNAICICAMSPGHIDNVLAWLARHGLHDTDKAAELRAEQARRASGGAPTIPEEAVARARELVAAGYQSISNKYRLVARLPEGKTGLEALAMVNPDLAAHFLENANLSAARQFMRVYAKEPERLELNAEEFKAFKANGGQSA
jgi:hypothetical protein